jgi:hypothetical protein
MEEAANLNEAQQRRLYASCQYIDGLLSHLEQALHQADSLSPFPRYAIDLDQTQMDRFEKHIGSLRRELLRTLAWQQIKPATAAIPITHMIFTTLSLIDIAIEELSPRHLRGYGTVPEGAIDGLNGMIGNLRSVAHEMNRDLRQALASREAKEE